MTFRLLRNASLLILTALLFGGCAALDIAFEIVRREAMLDDHGDFLYSFEDVDGHHGLPALSHERRAMYIRINKLAAHGKSRVELVDGAIYEGQNLHVWADSTLFRVVEKKVRVERLASSGPRSEERMRTVDPEWKMVPTGDIVRLAVPPPKRRVSAGQLAGGLAGVAAFAGAMALVTDNSSSSDGWGVPVGDVLVVALVGTAAIGLGAIAGGALASGREVFEMKVPPPVAGAPPSTKPD